MRLKRSMKLDITLIVFIFLMFLVGCQKATPVCSTDIPTLEYLSVAPEMIATPTPASEIRRVMIGRREIQVNKVVEGPLCNDNWSGTVFVSCDVQVYPWTEEPTFLKDCQLNIEPMTVVYVADHNNTAYYNGCSCHTGVTPEP